MKMEFHFISSTDADSRKRVRSLVMQGKNKGRKLTRSRPQKKSRQPGTGTLAPKPVSVRPIESSNPSEEHTAMVLAEKPHATAADHIDDYFDAVLSTSSVAALKGPFAGAEWTYFSPSFKITSSMRFLVYQFHNSVSDLLYPHEFCRPASQASFAWFEWMLSEPAFYHCLLAMSSSYISIFRGYHYNTTETARHFAQTLRLVNQNLSADAIPGIPTIAAVVSLAIQANLTGSHANARIHLAGLKHILSLYPSGMVTMRDKSLTLSQKIWRTAIESAMLEGTSTHLGQAPVFSCIEKGPGLVAHTLPYPLVETSPELRDVARETMALCSCPTRAQRAKLPPHQYQDVVISVLQRLVDFSPLDGPRPGTLDGVVQLGLLTFVATVLYNMGPLRMIYCMRIDRMLREEMQDARFVKVDGYQKLRLWLFFIYGLSTLDRYDGRWLAPQIRSILGELGLGTWARTRATLSEFPWIGFVHDQPGKKLWDLVMKSGESITIFAPGL